jgi:hypothetical protein
VVLLVQPGLRDHLGQWELLVQLGQLDLSDQLVRPVHRALQVSKDKMATKVLLVYRVIEVR